MAFCLNCGKDIGVGSSACDACGQKRPSAVAPLVGGIVIGITVALTGNSILGEDDRPRPAVSSVAATTPPATPHQAQAPAPTVQPAEAPAPVEPKVVPEPEPETAWIYTSDEDPMTSAKTYWATVISSNTVALDFPYGGAQHARLILRTHPRHGKDVIFAIERGQLLCPSYDGCTVLVRFDEQQAVRYSANGAADNSSEMLFLSNYGGFVEKLLKADRVRISAEIYQAGAPVFEFDVSGFDVNKYRPEQ